MVFWGPETPKKANSGRACRVTAETSTNRAAEVQRIRAENQPTITTYIVAETPEGYGLIPLIYGKLMSARRVLFILGTRPEAIKLAPVILHCRRRTGEFDVRVCVTAQHREMLDQVLEAFQIKPDHDL